MQYLFLLYLDPTAPQSAEDRAQAMRDHWAIMDEATATGVFRGASPVELSARSLLTRGEDGAIAATDGPFAETKELMAGYYLIECPDRGAATSWGRRLVATGRIRKVEIRPLAPLPPRP